MEQDKRILKQVITFLTILSVLTAVAFIIMFEDEPGHMDPAWSAIMMWMPAISAFITSLLFKERLRDYGWRIPKIKFSAYSYLFPIIIGFAAYGIARILGLIEFYGDEASNYKWARMIGIETPAPVLVGILSKITLASLVTLLFALGEEIGWSGFLTPKLLKLTSFPTASLIVGLYWALWHYPAIIEGGVYGYGTPLWVSLPAFTLVLLGLSFFRTYLVSRSNSLWSGTLLHVSHNVIAMGIFFDLTVKSEHAAYFVSETGIITGLVYLAGGLILFSYMVKERKGSVL